ncbi:MAG: hypothetical protein KME12_18880 [Trichocoleus desertorum ATA4-8-CV12]|jgi:hypothetical protein|nr:hypothetical protein [Trichocoleus desertorum ATA4-8-CV12]
MNYRTFEEVMAERVRTLDDIRATIEHIHCLVDIIAEQIKLEHQWTSSGSSSDAEVTSDRQANRRFDQRLGYVPSR